MVAWALALACLGSHLMHMWPSAPKFLHLFCSTPVHAATSALAIFGVPSSAAFISFFRLKHFNSPLILSFYSFLHPAACSLAVLCRQGRTQVAQRCVV